MRDIEMDSCINEWEMFCDQLKSSGREILLAGVGMDLINKADGLRYLGRIARGGLEKFVEYGDPLDPVLYKIYHEKIKWGFDNPDSIYCMAAVSGLCDYEVKGSRGTVNYFNISSMKMDVDGKALITSFLNDSDIAYDQEGNFTVILSATPQPGNWLPLDPSSNSFMIRQTFNDRAKEKEVEAKIRCISSVNRAPCSDMGGVIENFEKARNFFTRTGNTFVDLTKRLIKHVNELPEADPVYMASMGGDPNYAYFWSTFHVEPGKALLVHLPKVPGCEAWSLCLHNYWLESLDYHRAKVIINKHTAELNPDGSLTIIISIDDPEHPNWLNSCGHEWGAMMFRWTKPEEVIAPRTELVNLGHTDWPSKLKKWT